MKPRTSITLSREAFAHNSQQIKKAAGNSAVAIVLKSNAYGHGLSQIAQLAQEDPHIAWICTAGIAEALDARAQGVTKPILVLSYLDGSLDQAIQQDIHMGVYNLEDIVALNAAAQRVGKKAYIHIKIDTGMSRLGVAPEQTLSFIRAAEQLAHIEIFGLFTHLCDTPNPDQSFSYQQLAKFDELIELLEAAGKPIPCTHALSSSALCIKPKRTYTFVRAGAAFYGLRKSAAHQELVKAVHPDFNIKSVLEWKTSIIQLKKIPAGATVGYDKTWRAERPTLLAIAPIGYYDGYTRRLSNKGIAIINNHYAPIVGIVSMNMTAFDVTDIPNVTLSHDIFLMGEAPGITADECARNGHLITNELITSLHPSIERTIVSTHEPLKSKVAPHELRTAIKPSTPSF